MTQWGLDALFNPAKRHMDEEKQRLQATREQIGDSSGGKRVDLESGKVVINTSDDDTADDGTAEGKVDDTADVPADKPRAAESPAEARARLRRAKPRQ